MKIIGKAAIKAGNKYLALLYSDKAGSVARAWDFPGGAIEPGEEIEHSLARQVKEETGLDVKILAKLGSYETSTKGLPYYFVVYEAKIVSGTNVALSKEHSDYKWVGKNELLGQDLSTFLKLYLEDKNSEGIT